MEKGIVQFGDNSTLGRFSMITCTNKINIGSKVMIGAYVQITDHSHGTGIGSPMFDQLSTVGEITIANDVWIGSGAIILMNVFVGEGAVIAAGAVVNRDVPAYSVVAGVPARVVKDRR
jgi:acetyltransferase-like isoleucine patch superfamily enzyme